MSHKEIETIINEKEKYEKIKIVKKMNGMKKEIKRIKINNVISKNNEIIWVIF